MTDARDPFGRLLVNPEQLDMAGRVDCLRRLAGKLQADRAAESRWLGRSLSRWLDAGGDLEHVLGVRPARGSRLTPAAIARTERRNAALLRLAAAVGSDAAALRLLRGDDACPPRFADLVDEARELGSPTSRGAIQRARDASRHTR